MNNTGFFKHFGAVTALPVLALVMVLNSTAYNLSYNKNSYLQNGLEFLLLLVLSYFIIKKINKKYPATTLLYFIISLLIAQNRFISFGYHYTDTWRTHTPENAYEPNDFMWIMVLPLTIVFALLWGIIFDKIRSS